MASEIIMAIIGTICTIASGVVTFILTKRKYNTEVDAQVIQNNSQMVQNVSEAFDAYKKTMEDTIELHNRKIKMLEKENEELRQQVNHLQKQLTDLLLSNVSKNYDVPSPKAKEKKQ